MISDYQPKKATIAELLSTTSPKRLEVPEWQREYSWTKKEVGTFWSDVDRFRGLFPGENIKERTYFIGSVVLINSKNALEILDGQQRILTSAILLSSIRDRLEVVEPKAAEQLQTLYLGRYVDDDKYECNLIASHPDRDYFKNYILKPASSIAKQPKVRELASRKRVREARVFFDTKINDVLKGLSEQSQKEELRRLRDVLLHHVSVISVLTDDEDNAADIFEVLNDRGMNLSTSDLLKNLLMRGVGAAGRNEIARLWREISYSANRLELSRNLDSCLRHFWISHYGDVKGQSLYREIKEHLKSHKELSGLDLLKKLQEFIAVYSDAIMVEHDDDEINSILMAIKDVGATPLYPACLSAIQVMKVTDSRKIMRQLLYYYVRHATIGARDASLLENVVYKMARDIRSGAPVKQLLEVLNDAAPTDLEFESDFEKAIVSKSNLARYLLTELELHIRETGELSVADASKVHVEHIYPRKPKDGNRLDNHDELVNRLGNLTLLVT